MNSRFRTLLGLLTLLTACSVDDGAPAHRAPAFDPGDPAALDQAEALARQFAGVAMERRGVEDLIVSRRAIDGFGTAHLRMDQHLGGVPVFGAQAIVHVPRDGSAVWMTDGTQHDVQVDTQAALTEDDALRAAARWFDGPMDRVEVDLQILRHEGEDYLTWRVQIWSMSGEAPAMPVLFVDAHDAQVVWHYENLQTAKDRDTHDAGNGTALPGPLARQEGDAAIADLPVDDAHDYVGEAYDYYDTFQGRDSYDDAGATMVSVASYSTNYDNAFWNGSQMVYGDGGTRFEYLSKGLDVVAHEYTHAVTGNTANLIYANESGGLNEATSDIMCAVIESYVDGWVVSADTWNIGEDVDKVFTALRYMNDPPANGNAIDDYDDYTAGMSVHSSSGVANHAFYEWVQDADVTIEDAGDIWYRGLLYYMTPSTTYPQARLAMEQAAIDLFGDPSDELDAVKAGWDHVNVPAGPDYTEFDTVASISGSAGSITTYQFTPSTAATSVRFTIEGDGNADLYTRFGSAPDLFSGLWDCASASPDSYELCEDDPASNGTYYVTVYGFDSYSDLTIRAWQDVPCLDLDNDGVTDCDGDCDDGNASINPNADELCNNIDDNCDDSIDGPDSVDAVVYYADTDNDGFGDPGNTLAACSQPAGYLTDSRDCNDGSAAISPAATEVCNDIDDDCNGTTDGPESADIGTWYLDSDEDGFGNPNVSVQQCTQPDGYVERGADCNDTRANVNPAAPEVCDPADIDENCNGVSEEEGADGSQMFLVDSDGDGYGEFGNFVVACQLSPGLTDQPGDCDETDGDVYPGAPESCDDRRDTNCDGSTGNDDLDGDGHAACDECDDQSADRYPGATEVCDGIDNDCDNEIDNDAADARAYFVDEDGDGYGNEAVVACVQPEGTAEFPGDCNDTNAAVYPGALEIAGDDVDNDCDGADLVPTESDLDGDNTTFATCSCATPTDPAHMWWLAGLGLLVFRRRQR